MAASLISYFCTMVTACTVLMTVMNHFSTPHMFRQPHSVIPFKHSRTAPEPGKPSGAQLFGAGPTFKELRRRGDRIEAQLTAVGLLGKGISVSRVVGSYFSVRSILSSTNKLELGYRMADVKKFPRARGCFAQVSSKSGKNTSSMVRRRFVNPCS